MSVPNFRKSYHMGFEKLKLFGKVIEREDNVTVVQVRWDKKCLTATKV